MSIDPQDGPRPLPDRPNLRHLKDQAKDLVKAGVAASITDAQSRREPDDAQSVAAHCSLGLRQGWAADVGCRVSRPVGIAESGAARHGNMDARARVGRASGRRRTSWGCSPAAPMVSGALQPTCTLARLRVRIAHARWAEARVPRPLPSQHGGDCSREADLLLRTASPLSARPGPSGHFADEIPRSLLKRGATRLQLSSQRGYAPGRTHIRQAQAPRSPSQAIRAPPALGSYSHRRGPVSRSRRLIDQRSGS